MFTNPTEIHEYVSKLKGADLKKEAANLRIPGRTTMKAAELRDAIESLLLEVYETEHESKPTELHDSLERGIQDVRDGNISALDIEMIVPNRRDKRRNKKRKIKRQRDATEIQERFEASIRAGEKGKFYGNKNSNVLRVDSWDGLAVD